MEIDAIFSLRKKRWNSLIKARKTSTVSSVTCKKCGEIFTEEEMSEHFWVCPHCGNYLMVPPRERVKMIADEKSFSEMFRNLQTKDPLKFPDYLAKVKGSMKKTGNRDAIVTGVCEIDGRKVALGVFDPAFFMGSMGTVVGEKIVRLSEYAGKKKLPLLIFSASGGARMQEGLFSLMQMARTASAVQKFKDNGGLFISVLTNPTTGGVSASFASLGDISIGEPDALICFAGPRVIEQTIGQKLPEGFQHAEFLEEHGMLDMILERKDQKRVISNILKIHMS